MGRVVDIAWSDAVEEADWVKARLHDPPFSTVGSLVPVGFAAYARILHPARMDEGDGEQLVRWARVAALSSTSLAPDARFHSVALPPAGSRPPALSTCRPPGRGSLAPADFQALAALLRTHTTSAEACWFCLWEGYAWQGRATDPVPVEVLQGRRVSLPGREYVLYRGPVEAAGAATHPAAQTANLWWPRDQAWCVVSDIDLPWTYVGGPLGLVHGILAAAALEALPADSHDPVYRIESWVAGWVHAGVDELLRGGHTRIETPRGVVAAWFERPGLTPGALGVTAETDDGRKSGRRTRIEHHGEEDLRRLLGMHLTRHVVDLVEG